MQTLDQRQHPRHDVTLDAQALLGNSVITGQVLDWSVGGVFFTPEGGYVDGKFAIGTNEVIPFFEVGDTCKINMNDGSEQNVVVRWTGESYRHGCSGVGCQVVVSS